jgi:hypothetical protein
MIPLFDILKRRILFLHYKKITIDLPDNEYAFIKAEAKVLKISIDQFVENVLKNYINAKEKNV